MRPVRLAHTSDWHITAGPRFADTLGVLDWLIADAIAAEADLFVDLGDGSGTHEVPHVATVAERNARRRRLQRAATRGPVIVLHGNHDDPDDLEILGELKAPHPIRLVTTCETFVLETAAGPVRIVAVPFPHRRVWLPEGEGPSQEQNRSAADALRAWLQQIEPTDMPTILCGHFTVVGARGAGDEVLRPGKEVELTAGDLEQLPVDYIALGHIHLHQQVATKAWYCGSPSAQTFGETDPKGYLLVDVAAGQLPVVTRRPTPARQLVTLLARWQQQGEGWGWAIETGEVPDGAELKLVVEIPEAAVGSCPVDALKAQYPQAHAIVVDPRIVPEQRVRSEAIRTATTNAERLAAWWDSLGATAPSAAEQERLLERLAHLECEVGADTARPVVGRGGITPHTLTFKAVCAEFPDEVTIDLDDAGDGLIAFVGENGEGKTHVMELTGPATTDRIYPSYGDPVGKHILAPLGYSDLEFTSGGHRYRCKWQYERKTNKTEAWLWCDGTLIAGERVGEVDRVLDTILAPLKLRLASTFNAQSHIGSFFDAKAAEKKELFIRMLGLEVLLQIAAAAQAHADELGAALEAVLAQIAATEAQVVQLDTLNAAIATSTEEVGAIDARLATARDAQAAANDAATLAREDWLKQQAAAGETERRRERLMDQHAEAAASYANAGASGAQLRALIEQGVAIEAAAAESAELSTTIDQVTAEGDGLLRSLAPLRTEHAHVAEQVATLRQTWGEVSAAVTAARTAAAAIDPGVEARAAAAQAALTAAQAHVTTCEGGLPALEAAVAADVALAARRATLEERLADLRGRRTTAAGIDLGHPMCAVCPLVSDAAAAAAQIAPLEVELAALPAATGAAAELEAARAAVVVARTASAQAQDTADTAATAARLQAAYVETAATLPALETRFADVGAEGKALRERLDAIGAKMSQIETARSSLADRRTTLTTRRTELATLAGQAAALHGARAQLGEVTKQAEAAKVTADRLAAELAQLPPVDVAPFLAKATATGNTLAEATAAVAAIEAQRHPIAAANQRLQGERDALGDPIPVLEGLRARADGLRRDATDFSLLAIAFGRNGIQALEIAAAGPSVTAYTNDLLAAGYGNRFQLRIDTTRLTQKGTLQEVFDVVILDALSGDERKSGSGGQKVWWDEAVRLAFSIFNAQRGGGDSALWRDESARELSPSNAALYVRMLRRAAAIGGFKRIYLVSHSEAVWKQADRRFLVAGGRVTLEPLTDQGQEAA